MSTHTVMPDPGTVAVITDPQLQSEALTTVERATSLVVMDNETRANAAELGKAVAGLCKQAEEWFGPLKRLAAATHKEICRKENEIVEPLEKAKKYLSSQIGSYDQEQEKLRRAAEAKLQEEARQQAEADAKRLAEETAINDAIELEAAGDKKAAEAVLNNPVPQPVFVPPVVIPRSIPKAPGVSSGAVWKFRITDESLIPREYLAVDEKKIGQVVRAMKDKTAIPGIEAYPEGGARFRA